MALETVAQQPKDFSSLAFLEMTKRAFEMTKRRDKISPFGRNDRKNGRNDKKGGRNDKEEVEMTQEGWKWV